MKAYLVADIEVLDPATYLQYIKAAKPIVMEHGGRYLIRGGRTIPLSGDWNPQRLLVIEFDSVEQLQNCFTCKDYQHIAPLRLASTRARAVIVEGEPDIA